MVMNMSEQSSKSFKPELNVGAKQAADRFRFDPMNLRHAETEGLVVSDDYDDADDVRDQERNPSWKNSQFQFQDSNQTETKQTSIRGRLQGLFKMRHFAQKGGPTAFLAVSLLGGGMFLNAFMAPTLIINHMAERLAEKFDTQNITRPSRSSKLKVVKYSSSRHIGSYTGNMLEEGKRKFGFSQKKHRFASVNQAQIDRFKANGIEIETENGILGRKRIKKVIITDPSIGGRVEYDTPDKLRAVIDNNPVVADKVQAAARGRWGLMFDDVTAKVKAKLGILFQPLSAKVKVDADVDESGRTPGGPDDQEGRTRADTGVESKQALEKAHNDVVRKGATPDVDQIKARVGEVGSDVLNDAVDEIDSAKKTGFDSHSGISKLMGGLDFISDACVFYQVTSRAIYLAKTLKAMQLARYAGAFLTMSSALKAGDATEEQMAYFANKMNATNPITRDVNGQRVITGYEPTAMDSQGFYYAMTGMMGEPNESTRKYQMGVNDPGAIKTFLDVRAQIDSHAFGIWNLTQFCNVMASPFMSLLQGAVALISCFAGCGGLVASISFSVAQNVAYASARQWIADSIQRTLGGNVANAKTQGEDMGNALVSGSGYFLGRTANTGGNMPMTKDLALGFLEERDRQIARQAEIIRATRSPLDVSTRHTMMGSVVSGMLPYMARMQSFTGRIGSILSYAGSSFYNVLPRVSALSDADKLAARKATLDICSDPEYRIFGKNGADKDIDIHKRESVRDRTRSNDKRGAYENGNAVGIDPFCNWIFGIPSQQLNSIEYDPLEVLEFFAPNTFEKDEKGRAKPKLIDYGVYCLDNDDYLPPQYQEVDGKIERVHRYGATCFDAQGKPWGAHGRINSYIQGVLNKKYLMPVNKNGPCSFRPILSADRTNVLFQPWMGPYTNEQINNPCFEQEAMEGESPEKSTGYHGYQFWWEIDDRESQCSYTFSLKYHPPGRGSRRPGTWSVEVDDACPPDVVRVADQYGNPRMVCPKLPPGSWGCLDEKRTKVARSEYYIKALKDNSLSRFKYNCIDRGDIPYGKEELADIADPEEKPEMVKENRELEGTTVAEQFFGLKQGYVLDKGEECILDGRKDRTMFALYFMDERIQCMLDGGEDCDKNAMVSERYGSPTD